VGWTKSQPTNDRWQTVPEMGVCIVIITSSSIRTTNCPWKGPCGHCQLTSNFWKISDRPNISWKRDIQILIVFIKFELEVKRSIECDLADDLGWPITTSDYLFFYILRCLTHLRNWWSQRLQVWCRLQAELTAYGRQTVPHRGVVRSCDLLKMAPIISLERLNLKSSNFVHR